MKNILVSGSLAYDHLYRYPGVFQDELVPDAKGPLSVAFNVTGKTIQFGGCAGNIAYSGMLLKEPMIMLGIAGHDFGDYKIWLEKHGIATNHVIFEKASFTAVATVATDKKGQQITFFFEGASAASSKYRHNVREVIAANANELIFAHIAPNHRDFIMSSIDSCLESKVPFFFDPGQTLPLFKPAELIHTVNHAVGLFLNEYELELLQKYTGLPLPEILRLTPLVIVTLGEKGSRIYWNEKEIPIAPLISKNLVDPTGCGDAYRAGFLVAIKKHFPKLTPKILEDAGKSATRLATACLQALGTQNHSL